MDSGSRNTQRTKKARTMHEGCYEPSPPRLSRTPLPQENSPTIKVLIKGYKGTALKLFEKIVSFPTDASEVLESAVAEGFSKKN